MTQTIKNSKKPIIITSIIIFVLLLSSIAGYLTYSYYQQKEIQQNEIALNQLIATKEEIIDNNKKLENEQVIDKLSIHLKKFYTFNNKPNLTNLQKSKVTKNIKQIRDYIDKLKTQQSNPEEDDDLDDDFDDDSDGDSNNKPDKTKPRPTPEPAKSETRQQFENSDFHQLTKLVEEFNNCITEHMKPIGERFLVLETQREKLETYLQQNKTLSETNKTIWKELNDELKQFQGKKPTIDPNQQTYETIKKDLKNLYSDEYNSKKNSLEIKIRKLNESISIANDIQGSLNTFAEQLINIVSSIQPVKQDEKYNETTRWWFITLETEQTRQVDKMPDNKTSTIRDYLYKMVGCSGDPAEIHNHKILMIIMLLDHDTELTKPITEDEKALVRKYADCNIAKLEEELTNTKNQLTQLNENDIQTHLAISEKMKNLSQKYVNLFNKVRKECNELQKSLDEEKEEFFGLGVVDIEAKIQTFNSEIKKFDQKTQQDLISYAQTQINSLNTRKLKIMAGKKYDFHELAIYDKQINMLSATLTGYQDIQQKCVNILKSKDSDSSKSQQIREIIQKTQKPTNNLQLEIDILNQHLNQPKTN